MFQTEDSELMEVNVLYYMQHSCSDTLILGTEKCAYNLKVHRNGPTFHSSTCIQL